LFLNVMNRKHLLSICIPTYNRGKEIKRLIDSILIQEWFSDKIWIYIYDDPSTDNTQIIIQDYMKKYKNIHYHRNSIRLGMMPSILDSILTCTWEYIRLFGSDDIMWPYGIKTILSLIEKEKPDLILSNYWTANKIDKNNQKVIYKNYDNIESFCNNFSKQKSEYFHPSAINRYSSYFSYMSIYCFRNDVFKKLHDITLTQKGENYLLKHYFNYIYILLWNNKVKKMCLCSSPTLTYMKWGWESGWTMNIKIIKDVFSMFRLLNKQYRINIRTNLLFILLFVYYLGLWCIARIATLSKWLWCYDKLSHTWRKYILKSE